MNGRPSTSQLLQAVAGFLREPAAPPGTAAHAYLARVATNLVDTVQRELESAPAEIAAQRLRLQALLHSAETNLPTLQLQLCERIQSGAIDLNTPGLADHLWTSTIAQLAVDQPSYSTLRSNAAAGPPATGAPDAPSPGAAPDTTDTTKA